MLRKASELTTLTRQQIITGDIARAYNDVEKIADENAIHFFRIETGGTAAEVGRSLASLPAPNPQLFSSLDQTMSIYDDRSSTILFVRKTVFFDDRNMYPAGHLMFGFSYAQLTAQLREVRNRFVFFIVILCGVVWVAFVWARRGFRQTHEQLLAYFFALSQGGSASRPATLQEYTPMLERAEQMSQEILAMQKLAADAAVGKTARQVFHDIRSPLTALKVVAAGHLAELPEEKRVMIRNAVQRIEDITNDLVSEHRQPSDDTGRTPLLEAATVQLLSSVIEPLISEKRIQYRAKLGMNIVSTFNGASYGVFARVQLAEFKRVLSNLINNAVEAMGSSGTVTINMWQSENTITLTVQDTGAGISPEILSKLMQRGATFGKSGGSGLGLYHARTAVEAWGGAIGLESSVGYGTKVILTLPAAPAPAWFVPILQLAEGTVVVIVDDDTSIHHVWQERLDSVDGAAARIRVQHFSSGAKAVEWYRSNTPESACCWLCDYELLGETENGLDIIEQLRVASQAFLVTSRFEEPVVRDRAIALGVRLIPKGLAGIIPLHIEPLTPMSHEPCHAH